MTRGCPFGTGGNGVTDKDELIRQDLSHIFEIVKNKLRAFFIREKARADWRQTLTRIGWLTSVSPLLKEVKRSPQPVEAAVRELSDR
jgi:hypothetical protein